MPQVDRQWHSTDPNLDASRRRYHNNTSCTEGDNIEPRYKTSGTGGYPLCHHCDTLNKAGK